jgi:hypothetical protein
MNWSYIPLSIHRHSMMIELILAMFLVNATTTDNAPSDCPPPDHYGPSDTDDLRLRPIECLPDYCKNYYGDSGMYDLLERGPECD